MNIQIPVEDVIRAEVISQVRTLGDERTRTILRDEWTKYLATGTLQQWVQQEIRTALENSPIAQAADKALIALQETRKELEQVRQQLVKLPPAAPLFPAPSPSVTFRDLIASKWRRGRTTVAQPTP